MMISLRRHTISTYEYKGNTLSKFSLSQSEEWDSDPIQIALDLDPSHTVNIVTGIEDGNDKGGAEWKLQEGIATPDRDPPFSSDWSHPWGISLTLPVYPSNDTM